MQSLSLTVSSSLRKFREARGLTQAEVAEAVGIAVEAYGRLERGASLPSTQTLVPLASTLGVSTDEILGLSAHAKSGKSDPPELLALTHRMRKLDPRGLRLLGQIATELLSRPRPR